MIIPVIELREENGVMRAFREHGGREIPIPSYPRVGTDMSEWLGGLTPAALEAARIYYTDKWIWDEDLEKYHFLVDAIVHHMRTHNDGIGYTGQTTADAPMYYCPYIPNSL